MPQLGSARLGTFIARLGSSWKIPARAHHYYIDTKQLYYVCAAHTYKLVMSPSWNFPARAEPSYEGSEPSRAELAHFNFRAETEPNQKVPGLKKSKSPLRSGDFPAPFFLPFFLSAFFTCHQRYYIQSS